MINLSNLAPTKCTTLLILLIAYYGYHQNVGNCAPLNSSNGADYITPEELMDLIINSKLEDQCEVDQNRKDLCELCMRFLYDRRGGYLGCCTNYDGIHEFCQSFLNYSFEDQQQQDNHNKMTTTKANKTINTIQ